MKANPKRDENLSKALFHNENEKSLFFALAAGRLYCHTFRSQFIIWFTFMMFTFVVVVRLFNCWMFCKHWEVKWLWSCFEVSWNLFSYYWTLSGYMNNTEFWLLCRSTNYFEKDLNLQTWSFQNQKFISSAVLLERNHQLVPLQIPLRTGYNVR